MDDGGIALAGNLRRILILDEEFPFPLNSGKRIRSHNLLQHLARDFSVDYLAYGEDNSAKAEALRSLSVTPIAVAPHSLKKQGWNFYLKIIRSLFSFEPYIVSDHYSRIFKDTLLRLTEENKYDLIVVEWTPYAKFAGCVQSVPHMIVAHNIEWRIWEGYLKQERQSGKKLYIRSQIRKLMGFEKKVWRRADGVVAVSEVEAQTIRHFAQETLVRVVENGVDIRTFSTDTSSQGNFDSDSAPPTIVFVGALDWRPNQDAVRFLVEDILPRVESKLPDIQLVVVGRNPSEHIVKYGQADNIEVAGSVADVRPYMKSSSIFVVPLRIGGGSRLKILEAAAMKMAIVTTTRGADGLSLIAGTHYLQADEPEPFAEHVLQLLEDNQKRQDLGELAQKYVRERYDWSIMYREYKETIFELMSISNRVEESAVNS